MRIDLRAEILDRKRYLMICMRERFTETTPFAVLL